MRILPALAAVLLVLSPAVATDNELTEQEKKDGWLLLFDGKTLAGWQTSSQKPSKRPVEDGALNPHGCGGYMLIHERPWSDFVLALDFKISKGCNSGVFVRTFPLTPRPGKDVGFNGLEVAIDDTTGAGYHDTGAIYDLAKPAKNAMKPAGEWNHLVVTCDRNVITVELNGDKVTRLDLDQFTEPNKRPDGTAHKFDIAYREHPRKGYLGLQDHGQDCWYKNIKLKPLSSLAVPSPDIKELKLRDWEPRSMLVTKTTIVETPAVPVIDVHNHLGGGKDFLTPQRVRRYLDEMNAAGVRTVVNLDGGWDDRLKETLRALDEAHPGRFLTFALLDFGGIDNDGWTAREVKRLEEGFLAGAKGLKFHKTLGLRYRYKDGRLMTIDDPKLDPIWELCAKHKRPVMIHTSDPAAFFTPLDRFNERWHELNAHPEWSFSDDRYPPRNELLAQRNRAIARHPKTTFLCAHFANNPEDLTAVARWLDTYPNMNLDIDARISELGRQPYSTRRFIIKYQDRVMFGTDTTPNREAFRIYYRFLETDDEYFDCAASHHRQGFWMIYGIFLPKEVLAKVYRTNAERLLYGLR